MECVKTGFTAYISGRRSYIHGDAFKMSDGTLLLRISDMGQAPGPFVCNYTIHSWSHWFDELVTSGKQNSTMVLGAHDYDDHGYEGVKV